MALELVDQVRGILGETLSNIACVINPKIIVIGGGVSRAGQILIDGVRRHFAEHTFSSCKHTKFALAGLGNGAGMYGGVQMLPEEIDHISYLDGSKVYFKNGGWLIARFSGTEPLLRIFCEMPRAE